jgi:hypothetical protein
MLTTRAKALPAVALLAGLLLGACGGVAAPTPSEPAGTAAPTPTAVPGDPGTGGGTGGGTDPGSGGGSGGSGSTGSGIIVPVPGDPNANPLFGKATYVTPAQNLLNLHHVNVQLVRAAINDDGSTTVDLRWWSGVPPCSQLSAVQVARDDAAKTIRLTVIEGSGGGQVACIDIAQLTATQVELDGLASGAWTISAEGDAPSITLDVQ